MSEVGRRRLLGAGYAGVTFLAFPQPVAGGVLDLGVALAWLSPALLLASVEGLAPGAAFRRALLLSWLAHGAILHWIYVVTVTYGHAPPAVGVVAPLLLAFYIAPFAAVFAAVQRWWTPRGLGGPFSAALLWTSLDHLRSFLLTGFPWATLGYAQHANPWLLPWSSVGGVYALSFTSVLLGAAAFEWAHARRRGVPTPRRAKWAGAVVLALLVSGAWLAPAEPEAEERVRIAVVQGNIDQGVKWNASWMLRTLERYEELTREAAAAGAELVVWPETSVPGSLDLDPELRRRIAQLAREARVALVVGSVGIDPDPITGGRRYFDSAFVVHADGSPGERYDKTHLVPFGEYVPLRELLGRFVAALARGIATTDVVPGERPRAVEVLLAEGRRLRVGTPICYELLFPDLVRRFAADGGSVLLGMTNDAWYGRTGAPHQFFAMTALRAAETGVWTARAANTGVSGFIRGDGMGLAQTPVFEAAYRVADVPLHPDPARATFYVRHGDVFAWACWLAVAVLVARARMSDPPAVRAGPTEAG